jgi:hypothetical protein
VPDQPDLPPLRDVIAAHDLRALKSYGQHFLLDLNLTRRVARAAGELDAGTTIEVGPGPGGLTRALLAEGAAKVVAVERDRRCLAALDELAAAFPGRLEVVAGDAIAIDVRRLGTAPRRIVANLPYNAATPLLIGWLAALADTPGCLDGLVLMFQKEVAERLAATAGGLHAAAQSGLERGAPRAAAGARPSGAPRRPRAGHRSRLRPAPQDAATKPEIAGRRPARPSVGRRDRRDGPRGDSFGG